MFAEGVTRARRTDVYGGKTTPEAMVKSLKDTDAALTNAARAGQADAYRGHLAEGVRFHRADLMPVVGEGAVLAWLSGQPAYASGESRFAETSLAGDSATPTASMRSRATRRPAASTFACGRAGVTVSGASPSTFCNNAARFGASNHAPANHEPV
jgi:hypothetical protein